MRKAILFFFTVPILLLAAECYASDRSPTPPQELDTRPDDILAKAVQTEVEGTWLSLQPGYDPTIISNGQIKVDDVCSAKYSIVRTTVGTTIPDEHTSTGGPVTLTTGRAVSIKLKIEKSKCLRGNNFGFIQFSFLTTSSGGIFNFASVVQYDINDRAIYWYSLSKHDAR